MCKIKFVEVSQIMDGDKSVGMQYIDSCMYITEYSDITEAFALFKQSLDVIVTDTQSILIGREDAKRLSSSIANKTNDNSVVVFKMLKDYLKANYIVKRLRVNPRTLEYNSHNKVFIIHKL